MTTSRVTASCHCGAIRLEIERAPETVTDCNCSICRRYGVLWAYDYENQRIRISGPTAAYVRADEAEPSFEILFCPTCGCVLCWRGLQLEPDRRRRIAVNLRLAPPQAVADLPIDHFDGLETFTDLPRDKTCVRDLWF